jgi:hypothetical protein
MHDVVEQALKIQICVTVCRLVKIYRQLGGSSCVFQEDRRRNFRVMHTLLLTYLLTDSMEQSPS